MSNLKILIADDEPLVAEAFQAFLEGTGHRVVGVATTSDEAVDLAGKKRPDLVLMDIRMPGPGGIPAAEVIWNLYHIPVVFVTAYDDERENSLQARAFGYLVKPVGPEKLEIAVLNALYNYDTFCVRTHEHYHFAVDPVGRLLSLSNSAENFTGYSRNEIVGRSLGEFLAPGSKPTSSDLVKRPTDQQEHSRFEVEFVAKNGKTIALELRSRPVLLENKLLGISFIARERWASGRTDWPKRNYKRLHLIEKKYHQSLQEEEARELDELQMEADNHLGSLGEVDAERLRELRYIYQNLIGDHDRETSET